MEKHYNMKTTKTYPAKCANCNGTGVDYKQLNGYDTSAVCIVCNGMKVITVTEVIEAPSEVTDYPSDEEIRKHAEWAFGLSKALSTGWSRKVVDKIMDFYCDGAKWMRERMGQGNMREIK
jgi:hypothetical protein